MIDLAFLLLLRRLTFYISRKWFLLMLRRNLLFLLKIYLLKALRLNGRLNGRTIQG